ncbi:ABC transporter substrate-binding protein [Haloarchaeobius sp. DFWS5]|uniref:ABC transporter substrate-binding protein n=1 Tax=Haloarchaeobius sp. DFWS5 TaxID=3446114 RepID=UPI003EBA6021
MSNEQRDQSRSTRRAYLSATGAAVTAGLLAGCTGGNETTTSQNTSGSAGTDEPTETGDSNEQSTTTDDGPYSVSMSPMGEVEFEETPEDIFTVFSTYADMAVALGHGDGVNSVYVPQMSGTTMNHYYDRLDGVSFDWEGLVDPLVDGLPKEKIFELDSDVHFADPIWAANQNNWGQSDVDEVESQISPWFGNFFSGTQNGVPDGTDDYQFYSLWELFGKVAQVLREEKRYEALAQVHTDLVSTIEADLPAKEDRPTAVRVTLAADGEQFYTYHLNKPGYWLADTRPLGANDAFAQKDWGSLWGSIDYETMLEADPDVILHLWGMTPSYSMADTLEKLNSHPVGSQLTAVKEDRVYPAGMRYQGPLMNLFQMEMGAKQLYPEQFGEWPEYEDGQPYPEIPSEERLFDRERVAAIVRGDF